LVRVREIYPDGFMRFVSATRSTIKSRLVRAIRLLPRDDWLVAGWVSVTSALLFVFGTKSYQLIENEPIGGVSGWLDLWNRWDSDQYLQLAKFGYTTNSEWKAWLYPFFPWCVRVVAWVAGNYVVSALIVSGTALFVGAILFRRLVSIDFAPEMALRSAWFFLIFPTAYFLHVPYTESLFFVLIIGSLLAARRQCWWLAGMLGALSWMTRANGIIVLPTLAVEAAHQFWTTRRWNWRWLWIALVPAGFGVYLLLNWKISAEPFAFLRSRKALFDISAAWPWVGVRGNITHLSWRDSAEAEMIGTQELYFTALGLICVVAAWLKLRPAYAVWMTGSWLLVVSATFIESMPRYMLTMFPIFILFALLARHRLWNALITIWSLLFLALFTSLFVRGLWAF
jgi:Mannosyltransferase (PIG-V)